MFRGSGEWRTANRKGLGKREMKLTIDGRNLIIKDKKATTFHEIELTDEMLMVLDEQGAALVEGTIEVEEVHACMYCELLRNITWILAGEEIEKLTMVFEKEEEFKNVVNAIRDTYKSWEITEQNKKINGYAAALVEKMKAGIELHIVESSDEVKVPVCPVCGMQCDPDIPYCMECGASVE